MNDDIPNHELDLRYFFQHFLSVKRDVMENHISTFMLSVMTPEFTKGGSELHMHTFLSFAAGSVSW